MTNINKDKDKDKVWTEKDSIEAEIIQIADLLGFNEEKKIIEKEKKKKKGKKN